MSGPGMGLLYVYLIISHRFPRLSSSRPDDSLGYLLVDSARLLRRRFEAALEAAGLGLTAGEARALHNAARIAPARQAVLADRMAVEPMTIVGYLDRLERAGLVERSADPTDRRAKLVRPTEAAGPILTRIAAVAAAVRAEATAGLSEAEVLAFRATLERVRYNLDDAAPSPAGADAP